MAPDSMLASENTFRKAMEDEKLNLVNSADMTLDNMEDVTASNLPLVVEETPVSQPPIQENSVALPQESSSVLQDAICEPQVSICESQEDSMFVDDADAMEIELPPVPPLPAKAKRKRAPIAKMAPEHVGTKEDQTLEQLITSLHTMVKNADPEDFIGKQVEITGIVLRLKHLQDQQPPRVPFTPAIATSRRTRLEAALELLIADICAIPPLSWAIYRKKLLKFSETEAVSNMSFAQRLYKVTEIVYMPEELDALPKEDFERLEGVVRICATAAQALTVEGEESTDAMGERWVKAKTQDLEFFKKMFTSIRNTFQASVGEGEDVEMPWEKKVEHGGSRQ